MLCTLLLVYVVADGCRKGFDSSDCIEGSKIIVLQYPVLVLLILLVLYNNFEVFLCH